MNNECPWQKPARLSWVRTEVQVFEQESESVHYSLFMAAPTHIKKMED